MEASRWESLSSVRKADFSTGVMSTSTSASQSRYCWGSLAIAAFSCLRVSLGGELSRFAAGAGEAAAAAGAAGTDAAGVAAGTGAAGAGAAEAGAAEAGSGAAGAAAGGETAAAGCAQAQGGRAWRPAKQRESRRSRGRGGWDASALFTIISVTRSLGRAVW